MFKIIDYAIGHARLTIATLLFLLVAGFVSYQTIPKEAEPDVRIPIIYTLLTQRGISPEDAERLLLRPVALFDLLINNADRKGGHIIKTAEGHIWLIDHGLCFHVDDKLRTVVWDFAGEPIPKDLLTQLEGLRPQLEPDCSLAAILSEHLARGEMRALARRASSLVNSGFFPNPHPERRPYPWPPL